MFKIKGMVRPQTGVVYVLPYRNKASKTPVQSVILLVQEGIPR